MVKEVPQKKTFDYVLQLNSIGSFLTWSIFVISLTPLLLSAFVDFGISDLINWLLLILIPSDFIIGMIKTHYLMPKAEKKRRYDALDNSFGSAFSLQNSKEYFTNDEVEFGINKLGVNLFQNVFYTTRLSDKMMTSYIVKSSIFGVVFFIMAIYGLKNSPIMLPIFQFLFSAVIFGDLVKFLLFHRENNRILDELIVGFQTELNKTTILKEYLDYETNISWGQILICDKLFDKYDKTLEGEWQKLKQKFNINGK